MDATLISGRRFGLTADTHDDLVDWPAILAGLTAAFGPVDGVLHCGDITSMAALGNLAAVAPVYATRSDGDPPAAPPLLHDGARVLEAAAGVRIGLIFSLDESALQPGQTEPIFGGPVRVCVYGGTHEASIREVGGVLFVNPGSPSLAKTRTAALLTLDGDRPSARIVEIG
jgi:putative phosphoesterase